MVVVAAPAQGEGPPRHGHMLVMGVKFVGGEPVGFDKCIDLAAGRALPLQSHHAHLHTGQAGEALSSTGKFVVPTAPLAPFLDCEHLKELFPA